MRLLVGVLLVCCLAACAAPVAAPRPVVATRHEVEKLVFVDFFAIN